MARIHKWGFQKAEDGYNPNQPLCEGINSDDPMIHLAKNWKDVTCKWCHKIRKVLKKPHAEIADINAPRKTVAV